MKHRRFTDEFYGGSLFGVGMGIFITLLAFDEMGKVADASTRLWSWALSMFASSCCFAGGVLAHFARQRRISKTDVDEKQDA